MSQDLRSVIAARRLTPENVDLFLSAVVVLREHDLLEDNYGRTMQGMGDAIEIVYNGRDEDCLALVKALEARGMRVDPPTYDTGWTTLRRGEGYVPLVAQSVLDAYLAAMAEPEAGRPWGRLVLAFGGAAAAAAGAVAAVFAPGVRESLGGLFVPLSGLAVVAALGLAAWGASLLK